MPQLTNLRYLTQGPKPTRRQPTPELLSILGRYMLLGGKFVDFLPGENICHLSLRLKFGNQDQKAGRGSLLVSNRPTAQHSNIEGDNRARQQTVPKIKIFKLWPRKAQRQRLLLRTMSGPIFWTTRTTTKIERSYFLASWWPCRPLQPCHPPSLQKSNSC